MVKMHMATAMTMVIAKSMIAMVMAMVVTMVMAMAMAMTMTATSAWPDNSDPVRARPIDKEIESADSDVISLEKSPRYHDSCVFQ